MHHNKCNRQIANLPGVQPRSKIQYSLQRISCRRTCVIDLMLHLYFLVRHQLPKQYLCPFTTETTYARAFDMPQTHFQPLCAQQEYQEGICCGGPQNNSCEDVRTNLISCKV